MIGYLSGIAKINDEKLIILANGVGYLVIVSPQQLNKISNDQEISLFIYTHVKEDLLELYGFETSDEKKIFLMLLSVSGVGAKTALSMLSGGASPVIEAIRHADLGFFKSVPRVGKKLAQKIIIELKNKVGSNTELNLEGLSSKKQEVLEALMSLGFAEEKIETALSELDESLESEELLKAAMKKLQ